MSFQGIPAHNRECTSVGMFSHCDCLLALLEITASPFPVAIAPKDHQMPNSRACNNELTMLMLLQGAL